MNQIWLSHLARLPPKLNEDVSKEHLRTDASRNCFYNKGNIKAKEERLVFQ